MAWKYTGGGQGGYLPGIPARDLTDAEYRALPPEARDTLKSLGLYEHVADKAEAKAAKAEAPAGGKAAEGKEG